MKKVNFNALQNFEVPESWIENAINAKPKKKLFHLNPLHLSTAACLVIAVSNSIFSPLNLNRNFTPLTGSIVKEAIVGGADNSSTLTYPKDEELLTQNEIKTTFLAETTKTTEKPKATGATEQNEEIYEQEINSEDQDNESSESEKHSLVRAEESEQDEQSNNTKKPESIIKPQNPTKPVENPKQTEEKQSSTSEERVSTIPSEEIYISKGWKIFVSDSNGYNSNIPSSNIEENTEPTNVDIYFTSDIVVTVSPESDFVKYGETGEISGIYCYIKKNKEQIGIIDFNWYEFKENGKNEMIVNLYNKKCYIPCGEYDFEFIGYKSGLISRELNKDKIRSFPNTLDKGKEIRMEL